MRALALIVAITVYASIPASARSPGWTPKQLKCIASVGYTPEDWNAKRVPAGPAAAYRACRDGK